MNQVSDDNSIKIYDGVDECTMNDNDTVKNVKIHAKDLAQENLLKKITDYIDQFLKDRLLIFPKDEILSIANEIYNITDVKYNVFDSDDNLMIRATVTAQVDDNDIMNCLIRFFQERTELKSQNESFRKEIEDLKLQIAELHDKVILSYQKYKEANNLLHKKDYGGAIKLYNEAIELNQNFAGAYINRGKAYKKLGDKAKAEADFKKYDKLIKKI